MQVTSRAMRALMQYEWPGNVRRWKTVWSGQLPWAIATGTPLTLQTCRHRSPEPTSARPERRSACHSVVPSSTTGLEDIGTRATIERVFERVKGDRALAGKVLRDQPGDTLRETEAV